MSQPTYSKTRWTYGLLDCSGDCCGPCLYSHFCAPCAGAETMQNYNDDYWFNCCLFCITDLSGFVCVNPWVTTRAAAKASDGQLPDLGLSYCCGCFCPGLVTCRNLRHSRALKADMDQMIVGTRGPVSNQPRALKAKSEHDLIL